MRYLVPGMIAAATLLTPAAQAATLTVRVVGNDGKAVPDAVVSLDPASGQAPAPRIQGKYEVTQKDTQFHPFISVVPVGATVSFPNFDPFRHHVYSFSPTKRFELKLFARDQTRSVTFDKAGVVAVGCNIHDSMSAFIYVDRFRLDGAHRRQRQRRAARRAGPGHDADRLASLSRARPATQVTEALPASGADRSKTASIKLRPSPMRHMSNY